MLTIRKAQMHQLWLALLEPSLAAEMRTRFPEECRAMGDENLRAFTSDSLRRAKSLGLSYPNTVRFTAMEMVFGPEFYSTADWARRAYESGDTPEERVQRLVEAAVFRLAEESVRHEEEAAADAIPVSAVATALGEDAQPLELEVAEPAYTEPPEPDEITFPGADEPQADFTFDLVPEFFETEEE